MVDIKKLTQELKTLCEEANNMDYYTNGYVDGYKLEEIIKKHLDPDFNYYNPHWGKRPTVDRVPTTAEKTFAQVYNKMVEESLRRSLYLDKIFR